MADQDKTGLLIIGSPKSALALLILLICHASFTAGSGILEIRLLSMHSKLKRDLNGLCCGEIIASTNHDTLPCKTACTPAFRICLKEYQQNVNPEPPCTYGSKLIMPGKGSDIKSLPGFGKTLRFPFSFAWPGSFSIIIEVWHNGSTHEDEAANKQLLLRVAQAKILNVGSDWSTETYNARSSNNSLQFKYRAICDKFYYGSQCMQYCRPKDDGYFHYKCTETGQKVCLPGWTGRQCNEAVCKPGCHPVNGKCERPGECECKLGYIGEVCDQCQRYPGCKHGTCQKSWECTCEEGWGGLFCNQDLNYCTHHKPCLNGATCVNTGAGHYTCQCKVGFTGANCQIKIENCSDGPCVNGGTCRNIGSNYTCDCPLGFSGRHCQTFAKTCADNPCEHGATCVDASDGYMCLCAPGWEGLNCDIETDECQPNPCYHGGRCIDGLNAFRCVCPVGFNGLRCETNKNDCSANTCQNGGTCIDQVNSFKCECHPGFIGTLCQHNIDDCLKRPCANGGTCFDLVNDYRCACRPGFKGKDCSIDINECDSSPCRNGGSCVDYVDAYECHCSACFTGKNCQYHNDDCVYTSTFRPYIIAYNVSGLRHTASPSSESQQKSKSTPASHILVSSVSVCVLLVAVIVLLVILFIFVRRRVAKNRWKDDNNNRDQSQNIATIAAVNSDADIEALKQNAVNKAKLYEREKRLSCKVKNNEVPPSGATPEGNVGLAGYYGVSKHSGITLDDANSGGFDKNHKIANILNSQHQHPQLASPRIHCQSSYSPERAGAMRSLQDPRSKFYLASHNLYTAPPSKSPSPPPQSPQAVLQASHMEKISVNCTPEPYSASHVPPSSPSGSRTASSPQPFRSPHPPPDYGSSPSDRRCLPPTDIDRGTLTAPQCDPCRQNSVPLSPETAILGNSNDNSAISTSVTGVTTSCSTDSGLGSPESVGELRFVTNYCPHRTNHMTSTNNNQEHNYQHRQKATNV